MGAIVGCVGHRAWADMGRYHDHSLPLIHTPNDQQAYVAKITEAFHAGVLPLQVGTTLRSYLSDKLNWYVLRTA